MAVVNLMSFIIYPYNAISLLPEVPQDEFFLPTLYNVHQHDGNFFPIGWLS